MAAAAAASAANEVRLGEAIGEPPHVEVRLRQVHGSIGASAAASAAASSSEGDGEVSSYLLALSKTTPLEAIRVPLAARLALPSEAILLMYEGKTLDLACTLGDNGIVMPGPAARRAGAKVELMFDSDWEIVENDKKHVAALLHKAITVEEEARIEERAQAEKLAREEEYQRQLLREDQQFEEYIEKYRGVSQERQAALAGDPAAEAVPRHHVTLCSQDEVQWIERLMNESASSSFKAKVVRVYRNEQPTLLGRFLRAREGLRAGSIEWRHSRTAGVWAKSLGLQGIAELEAMVNEFPMWHGTTSLRAAGGVCEIGFDIGCAGSSTGSVYGPGFYLADDPRVSHGYTKAPWSVSSQYSKLSVMLLCRVLCGNIKDSPHPPSEEQKEQLTAKCLGPGGTFGAAADYHSVLGGSYAYVCFHRDQVYPAFAILYRL
mmetsp:Transcript_83766/g.161722  ORF Transcript_83766/g.161722 Transcript_83766/m.161722 type:complete len:433 (-) Transcript_83766:291-1589(-)